jgi:ribonuclease HI
VPSHYGIPGNEKVDELAKMGDNGRKTIMKSLFFRKRELSKSTKHRKSLYLSKKLF